MSGLPRQAAMRVLEINDYNLEQAICYHLENADEEGYVASHSQTVDMETSNDSTMANASDDNVRAPIPVIREQLILPGEDNFALRKRRAGSSFEVCPFRDFRREAELQEETFKNIFNGETNGAPNGDRPVPIRPTKRSRLEDLYRPPIELLFTGSFQSARDFATHRNCWLLVNVQDNSSFKCQVVNRDIWKDEEVVNLVTKYFILWQVSVDSDEGFRFKTFYHVGSYPYICVIDPRTGEEKLQCSSEKADVLAAELQEFLITNSFELDTEDTNRNTAGPSSSSESRLRAELFSKSRSNRKNIPTIIELSEEEQIRLAIKNSMKEASENSSSDNESDDEVLTEYGSKRISRNDADTTDDYRNYLGSESDGMTRMLIRLPDERRIKLEWPCTSSLRAIKLYIASIYPDVTNNAYKLIIPYSRQDVFEMEDKLTLKEAKMYPTVAMHLHKDD
uniref:Putative ubiquitin regulatory protein n=1 Tax=Tabanus bromius TaxID=304241 RepID=A0A0K8TKX4_TABBR